MNGFNVNMTKKDIFNAKVGQFQLRQQRQASGTRFQGVQW